MCTLAVFRSVSPLYPLIVVANRDEFLGRASSPPGPWPGNPTILAGRDLVAGGTWLGCRRDGSGRIVGILNRRPAIDRAASGPGELSRGNLCIDTLVASSVEASLRGLDAARARRYGGFNLFVADLAGSFVIDNGDGVRRIDLGRGLSVLTNMDVNDPRCPRLAGATRRFDALEPLLASGADVDAMVPALAVVLASHEDGLEEDALEEDAGSVAARMSPGTAGNGSLPFAKICVHVEEYGTRSSTMLFADGDGGVRYFHADGPPCATRFAEVATREMRRARPGRP